MVASFPANFLVDFALFIHATSVHFVRHETYFDDATLLKDIQYYDIFSSGFYQAHDSLGLVHLCDESEMKRYTTLIVAESVPEVASEASLDCFRRSTYWLVMRKSSVRFATMLRLDSNLIVATTNKALSEIHLKELYHIPNHGLHESDLGVWQQRGGLKIPQPIIWKRRGDLHGTTLNCVSTNIMPLFIYYPPSPPNKPLKPVGLLPAFVENFEVCTYCCLNLLVEQVSLSLLVVLCSDLN